MADENVQIWDGIDQEEEFDFDEEGVAESAEPTESESVEETLPVEFGVDPLTGQLTGGKVEGLEAIKVWAWNALQIPRYRYEQFSWDYGSELEDLIGEAQMPIDYIASEAERMVEECLTQNNYIQGIDDFECLIFRGVLVCAFKIVTTIGEVESNVVI